MPLEINHAVAHQIVHRGSTKWQLTVPYRREGGDQEGAIDVGHIEKCGPDVVCDSVMFITTAV